MPAKLIRDGTVWAREVPGGWVVETVPYGREASLSCRFTGPHARQAAHAWMDTLHRRAFPEHERDLWRARLAREVSDAD